MTLEAASMVVYIWVHQGQHRGEQGICSTSATWRRSEVKCLVVLADWPKTSTQKFGRQSKSRVLGPSKWNIPDSQIHRLWLYHWWKWWQDSQINSKETGDRHPREFVNWQWCTNIEFLGTMHDRWSTYISDLGQTLSGEPSLHLYFHTRECIIRASFTRLFLCFNGLKKCINALGLLPLVHCFLHLFWVFSNLPCDLWTKMHSEADQNLTTFKDLKLPFEITTASNFNYLKLVSHIYVVDGYRLAGAEPVESAALLQQSSMSCHACQKATRIIFSNTNNQVPTCTACPPNCLVSFTLIFPCCFAMDMDDASFAAAIADLACSSLSVSSSPCETARNVVKLYNHAIGNKARILPKVKHMNNACYVQHMYDGLRIILAVKRC